MLARTARLCWRPSPFDSRLRRRLPSVGEAQNKIVTLEERNAALSAELSDWKGRPEQSERASAQIRKELEAARTQLATQQNQLTEKLRLLETAKEESVRREKELEAARTQLATQQNQLTEKLRLLEAAKEESVRQREGTEGGISQTRERLKD